MRVIKILLFVFLLIFMFSCVEENVLSKGSIFGNVIININQNNLSGIEVKVKGSNLNTRTDSEGKFVLRDLAKGEYVLSVTQENYDSEEIRVEIKPGSVSQIMIVLNYKYGILEGNVTYNNDFYKESELKLYEANNEKYSINFNNNFKLDKIIPGNYTVKIYSEGYDTEEYEVDIKENTINYLKDLNLDYNYGGIQGFVSLENNDELENISVNLTKDSKKVSEIKTNNIGLFSFDNLPTGEYKLIIEKEGYLSDKNDVIVSKSKISNIKNVELKEIKDTVFKISGIVRLADQKINEQHNIFFYVFDCI